MGYYCTVPQCTSLAGKTKNVKFHRFPRDVTMADKWNGILKRGKPYTKYSKVCSLHFTQADYNVTTMGQWKTLSKDAIPSQNLPKLNPDGSVMVIRKSRTIKYRDGQVKKEDIAGDMKLPSDKWPQTSALLAGTLSVPTSSAQESAAQSPRPQDSALAYRLQSLDSLANSLIQAQNIANQTPNDTVTPKPEKQDAIMQTDPVSSEEDENQINTSYSDNSEHSFHSEHMDSFSNVQTSNQYQKEQENYENQNIVRNQLAQNQLPADNYEIPKDYTKSNEEYNIQPNKDVDDYEKERKHFEDNDYSKTLDNNYSKIIQNGFQKLPDMYNQDYNRDFQEKQQEYQNRAESYMGYQNGYTDSVDILRNQQHNLQMLQEQHRVNENQNFFNENHIKQEIDLSNEDDKYMYERSKEMESNDLYLEQRRMLHQQRVLEQLQQQVKTEPDPLGGCNNVMQPQDSPYYQANAQNNLAGAYYEQFSRPGPELLIAKQNALAAHTQLWQNTMKRPFFYSENPHYTGSQLLHRYEDLTRILQ